MTRPSARILAIQAFLLLGALGIAARAAQLQVVQGERWRRAAVANRTVTERIPARRGTIRDRSGRPLAVTSESFRVDVAPEQLRDTVGTQRAIARALGLPMKEVRARFARRYPHFRGPYAATDVEPLRPLPGVYLRPVYTRSYPAGDLAAPLIGALAPDSSAGASGLELMLDSLLAGTPGEVSRLLDVRGRAYDSPARRVRDPVPGHDVYLTLDAELQEIAERSLEAALDATRADGGDVVFLDVRTGEILALASRVRAGAGLQARPSALTDPYEPGSTAKIFAAAAVLQLGRAAPGDSVFAERGTWRRDIGGGKVDVIEDSHAHEGFLTLAQAIQVSSNIATAKFALRLAPGEHFDMLRAFGFGAPTGVEFPSEARGRLRRPDEWGVLDRPRIAYGYAFQATPLQVAAAYAAIANDGVLLVPSLVREIRSPDGSTDYRLVPDTVRRVVDSAVAATLREFLREAAGEGGTGSRAQLGSYTVLGKTGTARQVVGRGYGNRYTASFAAIFPADHPLLAVVTKLSNPQGAHTGGLTAAPLTAAMLRRALVVRGVDVDARALARANLDDRRAPAPDSSAASGGNRFEVPWPAPAAAAVAPDARAVPEVAGSGIRQGVAALHRAGFRVQLVGRGTVARTDPAAGAMAPAGTLVTVWGDRGAP